MNKRVNYMELLKESVADRGHDTTKSVDVKGPFLDPILGYDGGGELPTYKDASSILERYYFNQDADKGVSVAEEAKIRQVGDDKGALKDVPEDVDKSKKDAAKATELKEDEVDDGKILEEEELFEDDVENAVIERLIAEMEEDEGLLTEDELDESSPPQDPAAKFHEASGDPKKDKEGLIDGDDHKGGEDVVKKATFPAGSEIGKGYQKEDIDIFDDLLEMEDEPEEKDLDVDKEITGGGKETPEDIKESGSPIGKPATADNKEIEDDKQLMEDFDIFSEAMEEDDDKDLESDDDDDDDDDDKKK